MPAAAAVRPRQVDIRDLFKSAGRTSGPVLITIASSGAVWSLEEIAARTRLTRQRVACAVWRLRQWQLVVQVSARRAPVRVRLADAWWPVCVRCNARHAGDQLCGVL